MWSGGEKIIENWRFNTLVKRDGLFYPKKKEKKTYDGRGVGEGWGAGHCWSLVVSVHKIRGTCKWQTERRSDLPSRLWTRPVQSETRVPKPDAPFDEK